MPKHKNDMHETDIHEHHEHKPIIPDSLSGALKLHNIIKDDIEFFATTDISPERIRCDSFVITTKDSIFILSGTLGLDKSSKLYFLRRKKLKEVFLENSFTEFKRADYVKFSFEEQISSADLTATDENDVTTVIASATNSLKEQLRMMCDHLTPHEEAEGEESPHGMPPHHGKRPPFGPGGPHGGPHGGREKMSPKGPLYCPKCGKKFSDPRRRVCLHCMEKGKIIKRIFSFIIKYKFQVITTIVILVATGALGIITPYISSGFYYDEVLNKAGKFYGEIIMVLSLIIGTKILNTFVTIINNLINARIAANLQNDLKNVIFSSIERLSLRYFTDKQTGALMTQVNNDARTIYWFFTGGIPYYLVNIVQIICVVIIMFIMKPDLTILYLLMVPLIFVMTKKMFTSMGKFHGMRFVSSRKLNALISDTFSGMRVVKAFSKEKDGSKRFKVVNDKAAVADRIASRYSTIRFPITSILMLISNSLILGVGGWMVMQGKFSYGELLTFTAYTGMIYSPMESFVHMTYEATDSLNAMSRLVEVMDAESDILEAEAPVKKDVLDGEVEFSHVDFGYDKSRTILHDIDFKIEKGTILGVVGHTGAGKSTLANLLLRMYDPDKGEIKVDGISLRDIDTASLRNNIAIVSQETYLFVGTILDNIKYANPNASYEEIIRAAKISGAHDFIIKLPDGYATKIGFGQRELSGGERQRLSIARALLRDPAILILDEATAAMDTQTERKIQTALEILIQGKTTIMIAHRLSTLRMADSLIVLKDGKICESGSHDELIRAKGEYYKLYTLQLAALKNVGVEG